MVNDVVPYTVHDVRSVLNFISSLFSSNRMSLYTDTKKAILLSRIGSVLWKECNSLL